MLYEQIILLLSCYFLLFLSYLIGFIILSKNVNGIVFIFSGYSFIYVVFLFSAFINSNFIFYFSPIFLIGIFLYRLNSLPLITLKNDFIKILIAQIIISPFLIYTLFLNNLNWDDYATWLPNAYYIFEHGHLPKNGIVSVESAHPSYPYAFPIFIGLVNQINGHFHENIAPMFNVIFLSLIITLVIPNKTTKTLELVLKQIYLIPFLLLAVLIMNSKGIFGAGPDLIICMITCTYVYYDFRNHLLELSYKKSCNFNTILFKSFLAIALVGTKQVGVYILLIIELSALLTKTFLAPKNSLNKTTFIYIFINFLIPVMIGIVIHNLWNYYAQVEGIRLSFGSFSLENIRFRDIDKVIMSMWYSTIEKPYVLIALIANLYFFKTIKKRGSLSNHFAVSSFIFSLMIICFLMLAYLTVFGEYEGNRAASFERYIAPAGFVALINLLCIINKKRNNTNLKVFKTFMLPILICVFYIMISISEKNRIIRSSNINFPQLIKYFQNNFDGMSHINIFDFHSLGFVGHILNFKLYGKFDVSRYDPLNFNLKNKNIEKYINQNINIFFGEFNDKNIKSIISKSNLKKTFIIKSIDLNLIIFTVKKNNFNKDIKHLKNK